VREVDPSRADVDSDGPESVRVRWYVYREESSARVKNSAWEKFMVDRAELLESVLENLPDGLAVLDNAGLVIYWNQAAQAITGYTAAELLKRSAPDGLAPLLYPGVGSVPLGSAESPLGKWGLINARHKLGHQLQAIGLCRVLRDEMGQRLGSVVLFHPAAGLDALPHGETGGIHAVAASQQEMEERLQKAMEDFEHGEIPFGVIWVSIDQAHDLRKTHGVSGCEAMLGKVQYVIEHGMRPADELGRWGKEEFLVIAHERTPEMLEAYARTLCGLARTADFRWWGDRVTLTASIGVVQAGKVKGETLAQLLQRAQKAMEASTDAGGNQVTAA
jgi:diguanylate cyclase (GGDEF)-like protein